jgi:hypothetical protein
MDHSRQRREKQIEYAATLATSSFGTKQTFRDWVISGFGAKADVAITAANVCF